MEVDVGIDIVRLLLYFILAAAVMFQCVQVDVASAVECNVVSESNCKCRLANGSGGINLQLSPLFMRGLRSANGAGTYSVALLLLVVVLATCYTIYSRRRRVQDDDQRRRLLDSQHILLAKDFSSVYQLIVLRSLQPAPPDQNSINRRRADQGSSRAPFNAHSTPTLNELNQLVVWRVAAQWYDIGLFLEVGPAVLDTIRADNPHSVRQACRDMFNEWLSHGPGTGEQPRVWRSVLSAVKQTVGERITEEIEGRLLS